MIAPHRYTYYRMMVSVWIHGRILSQFERLKNDYFHLNPTRREWAVKVPTSGRTVVMSEEWQINLINKKSGVRFSSAQRFCLLCFMLP